MILTFRRNSNTTMLVDILCTGVGCYLVYNKMIIKTQRSNLLRTTRLTKYQSAMVHVHFKREPGWLKGKGH